MFCGDCGQSATSATCCKRGQHRPAAAIGRPAPLQLLKPQPVKKSVQLAPAVDEVDEDLVGPAPVQDDPYPAGTPVTTASGAGVVVEQFCEGGITAWFVKFPSGAVRLMEAVDIEFDTAAVEPSSGKRKRPADAAQPARTPPPLRGYASISIGRGCVRNRSYTPYTRAFQARVATLEEELDPSAERSGGMPGKSPRSEARSRDGSAGTVGKRRRVMSTRRSVKRSSRTPGKDPFVTTADVILGAGGKMMVFTGAGVSEESGVPTYRDPGGIWESFDSKQVGHITGFLSDPEMCWRFEFELWKLLVKVNPNPAHSVLAAMEARGFVGGVITQNVDGLHQLAGSSVVHELHGNEMRGICLNKACRQTYPATAVFQFMTWVDAQLNVVEENVPPCPRKEVTQLKQNAAARKCAGRDLKAARQEKKIARLLAAGRISAKSAAALRERVGGNLSDSDSDSDSDSTAASLEGSAAGSPPSSSSSSPATATSISSDVSLSSSESSDPDYNDIMQLPSRTAARQRAPRCPRCEGVIKPDAVYFGEPLDFQVKKRAYALSGGSKVCMVVGSSCIVSPANKLPLLVKQKGGRIIEVNPNKTVMTPHAALKVDCKAGVFLPLVFRTISAIAAAQAAGLVALAAAAADADAAPPAPPPPAPLKKRRSSSASKTRKGAKK